MYEAKLESMLETADVEYLRTMVREYNKAFKYGGLITKTDTEGIITFASDKFCELTGYQAEELIGSNHSMIRHPSVSTAYFRTMWLTISKKEIWSGILKNQKRNGETFLAHTTIIPIVGPDGTILEYIAMRHDISELLSGRKVFHRSYRIDLLTGLGNRTKLFEDLSAIETPLVSLLNIRYLKEINSLYGFEGGDAILEQMGDLLHAESTKVRLEAYRLNGDEFALLANDSLVAAAFREHVVRIGEAIEAHTFWIGDSDVTIKINIGISLSDNEAMLHADLALKEARKLNRLYSVIDSSSFLTEEYKNTLSWKKKIAHSIQHDCFFPYFHAIVCNATGRIESYEVLIRLRDGEHIVSPGAFLSIAKQSGLYRDLTRIMIRKSFDYFHEKEFRFSINLNIEDIEHDETRLFLKNMIFEYFGIQKRLTIELVESEGIENFNLVNDFIREMKQLGCKIAIDDFGSGYSNFEYLMKLDVDVIKIDGSLIQGMLDCANVYNVVETIVHMAQKNGLKTVAEFVSDEKLYDNVCRMGIDYSQGYYLYKPMPTVIEERT